MNGRNYLGEFAPSLSRKWTKQAYDCYSIGCDCSKCSIPTQMTSKKCQMKAIVLELNTTVGKPTKENCTSWSFFGRCRKRNLSKLKEALEKKI